MNEIIFGDWGEIASNSASAGEDLVARDPGHLVCLAFFACATVPPARRPFLDA